MLLVAALVVFSMSVTCLLDVFFEVPVTSLEDIVKFRKQEKSKKLCDRESG